MTLYRKYRPQKFADLVGQDHIRDTLIQAVREDKLAHAYLFTGPRGTGKTTTARLISKVANCQGIEKDRAAGKKLTGEPCGKCDSCLEIGENRSLDIIEIDAASNRGIDDIRSLREQVRFAPAKSKYKVYIIDEVHMLTKEAFNALLKTLEEPPKHAIFILATTEPYKVLPTIISRTQRFDFKRISATHLVENLKKVTESEGLKSEPEALEMLAVLADGGGRDSLSLLEQIAAYSSDISVSNIRTILGVVELNQIVNLIRAIFNSDAEEGLKIAHSLYTEGMNLAQLNASIVDVLRKLMTYTIAETFYSAETDENKKQLMALHKELINSSGALATSRLLAITKNFIDAGKMIKDTVDPLVAIEVAIVESVDSTTTQKLKPKSQNIETSAVIARREVTKLSEDASPKAQKEDNSSSNVISSESAEKQRAEKSQQSVSVKEKIEDSSVPQNDKGEEKSDDKSPSNESTLPTGRQMKQMSDEAPLKDLPEEVWQNVISEVKKENNSLAALLKDAKPMAVDAGRLVLGVRFKFHKDKISEAKNVQVLEGVICSVTGNSCRVQCEIADFSAGKKKESHSDDELASEAEKVFGE